MTPNTFIAAVNLHIAIYHVIVIVSSKQVTNLQIEIMWRNDTMRISAQIDVYNIALAIGANYELLHIRHFKIQWQKVCWLQTFRSPAH